jgi:hypothetical protein
MIDTAWCPLFTIHRMQSCRDLTIHESWDTRQKPHLRGVQHHQPNMKKEVQALCHKNIFHVLFSKLSIGLLGQSKFKSKDHDQSLLMIQSFQNVQIAHVCPRGRTAVCRCTTSHIPMVPVLRDILHKFMLILAYPVNPVHHHSQLIPAIGPFQDCSIYLFPTSPLSPRR